MKSISCLFEKTDYDINPDHRDRMSRRYRYFKNLNLDNIPKINYPKENSIEFKKDLDEVVRCYNNPSLTTKFLYDSNDSVSNIFENFCKENGYKLINWKKIKDILNDIDTIVLKLKYKNKRPRPLHYLRDLGTEEFQISYKKSPSFPSGHTTMAYFLCDILSKNIPELQQDFQTLASLIGQTRIENAVHFPTDIEYGRLVGENLANLFLSEGIQRINSGLKSKHYRSFSNKLCKKAKEIYTHNDEIYSYDEYAKDLASFLHRTNEIEFYKTSYSECLDVAKHLMMGFPSRYSTSNEHIISQVDALVMANKCEVIDNNYKVVRIHECFLPAVLEKGKPGEFRNFSHMSRAGIQFPEPYDLNQKLNNCHALKDKAWLRHLLYEYIHPFCDGNGRSGRIILSSDLDFNFSKVNQLIGKQYIPTIVKQMIPKKLEKLL